jgi:hypothetical protein
MGVLNPTGLLIAQHEQVVDDPNLAHRHDEFVLKLKQEGASPQSLAKLRNAFGVWLANQKVFRDHFAPAEEYLALHQGQEGPLALFTSYPTGWPFDRYVPYFYRDWCGTNEAESVAKIFSEAITRYARKRNARLAVLGCGACGLLYQLSDRFDHAFGLDISVPSLLLAKCLLEGGETTLGFNLPNEVFPVKQSLVRIGGVERREGITHVAANVKNMPFPPNSFSCVTTQYLLDLVNFQAALAGEIHRVLVPDGLWINFGLPASRSAFDVSTHLDLPRFLGRNGFTVCEVAMHGSSQLDLTPLSELSPKTTATHVFFTARKSGASPPSYGNVFTQYFCGNERPFLEKVLRLSDRFVFSIGRETRFPQASDETGYVLEVRSSSTGWQTFKSPLRTSIPESGAQFLELVLSAMDGTRTVFDLMNLIEKRVGPAVSKREIAMFFRALHDSDFCEFG